MKLKIEIIARNKIYYYKLILKDQSLSYYPDFLLNNVVFVTVSKNVYDELKNNNELNISETDTAYLM